MQHTRSSRFWFGYAIVSASAAVTLLTFVRHPAVARAGVVQGNPPVVAPATVSKGDMTNPGKLSAESANTATPIKHLIVIVGENHTFDNVFATYKPQNGQTVLNLLSQGIVSDDGSPGSQFSSALPSRTRRPTPVRILLRLLSLVLTPRCRSPTQPMLMGSR